MFNYVSVVFQQSLIYTAQRGWQKHRDTRQPRPSTIFVCDCFSPSFYSHPQPSRYFVLALSRRRPIDPVHNLHINVPQVSCLSFAPTPKSTTTDRLWRTYSTPRLVASILVLLPQRQSRQWLVGVAPTRTFLKSFRHLFATMEPIMFSPR
jgi:hypothetical protein